MQAGGFAGLWSQLYKSKYAMLWKVWTGLVYMLLCSTDDRSCYGAGMDCVDRHDGGAVVEHHLRSLLQ